MNILGIDTSAVSAGAAIVTDGKLISETYINTGLTHSQTIMCLIDSAIKNADMTIDDIDIVAVSSGPGSFTGIRIGVSAVKGICFQSDKPCYGISTLEALANCVDIEDYIICPVMDARCKQVYTALFEKRNGEILRLSEDSPKTLDELAECLASYDKKIMLIGDGSKITAEVLSDKNIAFCVFSEVFKYQHASGVAITAYRNYNKGIEPYGSDKLQPNYLRLSQAERELKNRSDK